LLIIIKQKIDGCLINFIEIRKKSKLGDI